MSDAIDSAQQRDEFFRETAIQEHFNRGIRNTMNGVGTRCAVCDEEIPAARRKALPGCCKCVVCQQEWEMMHGKQGG